MTDSYVEVADLMFNEFNEVSAHYDLPPFESLEEVEQLLRDNIDPMMIDDLVDDENGRMALAGFLSTMMFKVKDFIVDSFGDDDDGSTLN